MGCCGNKCICPPGPAGPTSADVVFAQSDLPTSQGGIITLEADTTYWIAEEVVIDDGIAIQMSSGTCLIGNSKYCSKLIGNVSTGAFIRGLAGSDLNIQNLTVENTGGQTVSFNGGGTADAHLINVVLDGTTIGLSVVDADEVDLHNVDFLSDTFGLTLGGTIGQVAVDSGLFVGTIGVELQAAATADGLRVSNSRFSDSSASVFTDGGSTLNILQLVGNSYDVNTGIGIALDGTVNTLLLDASDFDVAAGATGLSVGGTVTSATVDGNAFRGAGAFRTGIDSCTDGWEWDNNTGVQNTLYGGQLYSTGFPAVVNGPVSAAAIVPVLDTGSCKFALGAGGDANKLVYTGNKSIRARIEAVFHGVVTTGSDVDAQILINGVGVGMTAAYRTDADNAVLLVNTVVVLNPGDVIDLDYSSTTATTLANYMLGAMAA